MRELCARYPLAEGGSLVYAVDVRTNTPTISQEAFRTICRTKGRTSENYVNAKFAGSGFSRRSVETRLPRGIGYLVRSTPSVSHQEEER